VEKMKKYQTILYEKKDNTASITLNRPEVMNAINRMMFLEIGQALDDAEQDGRVSVVVIKGAGRSPLRRMLLTALKSKTW
jgi:enoyl-CoA hydratase/carnithine racemase